jgi:CDP-diacylglycerol--glycerol-3-phosphate 3-phosphatidyltransferase
MTFANKVTLFRILSIPFFIASLISYSPKLPQLKFVAIAIFLLAIVSDVVDGYIARRHRQKTRAGAILDPLADKALVISAFICLWSIGGQYFHVSIPLWAILIIVFRDIALLIGSGIILSTHQELHVQPTCWGKWTTFFQMMTILCLLLEWSCGSAMWKIAVLFTLVSGIDYFRKGINILNTQSSHASVSS